MLFAPIFLRKRGGKEGCPHAIAHDLIVINMGIDVAWEDEIAGAIDRARTIGNFGVVRQTYRDDVIVLDQQGAVVDHR